MAFPMTRTNTRNTKTEKKLERALDRAKSLSAKVRESGRQVQEVALTSAGAFAAPYLATKFFSKGDGAAPTLLGLPAEAAMGALAFGVGMMAESEPIANLGKGAIYAGAARFGAELGAKK